MLLLLVVLFFLLLLIHRRIADALRVFFRATLFFLAVFDVLGLDYSDEPDWVE